MIETFWFQLMHVGLLCPQNTVHSVTIHKILVFILLTHSYRTTALFILFTHSCRTTALFILFMHSCRTTGSLYFVYALVQDNSSLYFVYALVQDNSCLYQFTWTKGPCELLPSLGVRRLSSVVCCLSSVNFSHFKLLLRNHRAD